MPKIRKDAVVMFREALSNLAAPPAQALAALRWQQQPVIVESLARDYEDAFLHILDLYQRGLSDEQQAALYRVSEVLSAMKDDSLWTELAVREHAEWTKARAAANAAIRALQTRNSDVADRNTANVVNSWKWTLHELVDAVVDERTLLIFLHALHSDRMTSAEMERETPSIPNGPYALGWQNDSIENYLSGALSWANSTMVGEHQGLASANPWRRFAAILYAGKTYNRDPAKMVNSWGRTLPELVDAVVDERTLLMLLYALFCDRMASVEMERETPSSLYGPYALGWYNNSIENYLSGALSWAESTMVGAHQGLTTSNPWRRFAALLYVGKIYE